jgi:hypothetical protein
MKHIKNLVLILCLFATCTSLASGTQCSNSGEPPELTSVLKQRELFNQAIVDKDIKAIESVLHEDVILISGTDSDVYIGIEAQLAIWSDDFSKPGRAVYVRTPMCVRVSPVYPVALEYGTWRGEQSNNTGSFAAGSYAAKWRMVGAHWQLESEIFATESCGGGFCPEKAGGD